MSCKFSWTPLGFRRKITDFEESKMLQSGNGIELVYGCGRECWENGVVYVSHVCMCLISDLYLLFVPFLCFPPFRYRTMNSVFDILSWSFWCSKRYLRWPEWNFSTSLAARMVFSLGQWKMIRGSCWLSFAAHPIRIYPRVPYWLFFKIYAFPPPTLIRCTLSSWVHTFKFPFKI